MYRDALPQLGGDLFLTDSGFETDLIFNGGWELPEFASFPLIDSASGRDALEGYLRRHVEVADRYDCGVILEAPTWRASPNWGRRLGYSLADLRRVNVEAIAQAAGLRGDRTGSARPLVVSACVGPAGDAYLPAERMTAQEAEDYHLWQVSIFADTAADLVHAMTFTYPDEAIGLTRAAQHSALPVAVSFTVETDGRLPDGTELGAAIAAVDAATDHGPVYYGINCAYPTHFASSIPSGDVGDRLRTLRPNASSKSHAELDEAETLDAGDRTELANLCRGLLEAHPQFTILGGCCGTDVTHVEAMAAACVGGS